MRIERKYIIPALAFLILLGLAMAFDQKFVSFSDMIHNPLAGIFIYFPTALFALIGLIQFLRGRTWPAVAFTAGLIGTGLFHQSVIGFSYGNPGYMFPSGHIVAPLVSLVAYSISFLVVWGITRVGHSGLIPKMIKKIRDILVICFLRGTWLPHSR